MSFTHWLRNLRSVGLFGTSAEKNRRAARSGSAKWVRLHLECFEERCQPSTFTVTNLFDSGPGSLRAAVVAGNANPGPDTIDFTTTGRIALTSGQLDITDSLTINGPGANALTVSGNQVSRVFRVAGNPTVLIADLTVANGYSDAGGGIFMSGGTLTLDRVTVVANAAVGDSAATYYGVGGQAYGGGLCVGGGTLTLNQCTVTGNVAVGGWGSGGEYVQFGSDGGRADGGGIYVASGVAYINQSTISYNRTVGGGGGWADSNYFSGYLGENTYGGNGGSAAGGGIFSDGAIVNLDQSSVFGNSAVGGPGGSGTVEGFTGVGVGGGLNHGTFAPPRANLDSFTEANTINNVADIDPNIAGTYRLNGAWVPPLAISDVSLVEGNSGTIAAVFTVSLSAPSNQAVTVNYTTVNGSATAGSDYQAAAGTLTIPAGQTTGTITVPVKGDRLGEPNESFFVNLSSATNATIADGQGQGAIVDDEPRVTVTGMGGLEGNTGTRSFTFTVRLSGAYDAPVSVNYATADGTATAGSDYAGKAGVLTFAPGETSKTVNVLVYGDRVAEYEFDVFYVDLSGATNAVLPSDRGGFTILDDEPRISISDVTKAEGKKNQTTSFTFTVTLSAAYDQAVTMSFATVNGTANTSNNDYIAKAGTLTFAPGQTTKTITIEVKGDSKKEANETFFLDLFGNSGNSLFAKNRGIGTILNDD